MENISFNKTESFEKKEFINKSKEFIQSLRAKYADILDSKFAMLSKGGIDGDKGGIWFPAEGAIGSGTGPHTEIPELDTSDESELSEIRTQINSLDTNASLLISSEDITLSEWLDRFDNALDLISEEK